MQHTLIQPLLNQTNNNRFFMKRDDLMPFSFGGNKARKAIYFKEDILKQNADIIVTYGSSESNHCRIIANLADSLNKECYIVSPAENYEPSFNSLMVEMFGAKIIKVPVNEVSQTIDQLMKQLSKQGNPYFIPGGGHGNLGTQAYVDAYHEIRQYEEKNDIFFDYVFFASGTGTTHAGLVCGQWLHKDFDRKIVGISIAREQQRGMHVIAQSIQEYLNESFQNIEQLICFTDEYICGGYGKYNAQILQTIRDVLLKEGIALNKTYTAKAFFGMQEYIKKHGIINKNVLFINTGGLPLFFNDFEVL